VDRIAPVTGDSLKLTVYFGESDRVGRRLLASELLDRFEEHAVKASLLLRGIEGFGLKHKLHTQRLLTLSEDLPLVAIAVDSAERIEALLPGVEDLVGDGLVTLERARFLGIEDASPPAHEESKLTLYLGRLERAGRRAAFFRAVDVLHDHGVAGATVVLGVDGVVHGTRRRARFFGRNADVPLMVIAVGETRALLAAVAKLREEIGDPLATLERVRVLKRDGRRFAELEQPAGLDEHGLAFWQKLTIFAGERAHANGHPLYVAAVRGLREEGASGATALRGMWGYSGDHEPHGERFLALRRHVPVVVVAIDRPEALQRLWPVVDAATAGSGLVTCETVPALRAVGGTARTGGLRLAG
jgi:PII-like signaling protein